MRTLAGKFVFWGALLSCPAPAHAQSAEVSIRCEELTPEERARIEVRLLTELRSLPSPPGILELSCEKNSVRGGWLKDGTLLEARNLTVAPGDNRTEMLLWISSLLLETESDRDPATPLEETSASASAPEVREIPAVATAAPETTAAPEQASAETTSGTSNAETETDQLSPAAGPIERRALPASIELGLAYAHFGTELDGAIGPHFGGHIALLGPFGATLATNLLFGTETPASLQTFEGAFFLGADWAPVSAAQVLLGPSLSWARVSDASASLDSLTFGVEASLKAYFPQPLGFFAQMGIRGLADERRVVMTDPSASAPWSATFIPHWSVFFALGGALELRLR